MPVGVTKRSEHVEAVTLMRVICLHQRQQPELALFFAVPNGGDRNPIVAAKMKAEGVRAGVPDYLLPVARQGFHGLAGNCEKWPAPKQLIDALPQRVQASEAKQLEGEVTPEQQAEREAAQQRVRGMIDDIGRKLRISP